MAELWITIAFVGAGAVFCLWFSLRSFHKARVIEDTPTSNISSAAQGFVELVGSAKPDQSLLKAPLTNTPCLWYKFQVERYETSGKRSTWRVVRSGTRERSFYLEDGTGVCHVHPEGADVSPHLKQVWRGNSEIPLASTSRAGSSLFVSGGRYRYTESRIHEGELLYGLGLFQTVHALSSSQQAENHKIELLAEWKKDHQSLLERFDMDGDGQIDMEEWNMARQEAARHAQSYVLENFDSDPAYILCKPPVRSQHFILSCKDPKKLAKHYRWRGIGLLVVFLTLVGFLYSLLSQAT